MGDPIHLGGIVVVVPGWEPIVSDNDFIKPDPGNRLQSGIDGKLLPGERIRGKVGGYQVPTDANGLLFGFLPDLFEDPIYIAINLRIALRKASRLRLQPAGRSGCCCVW